MKKRVLFYVSAVIATFSLQSCVTNYVASAPKSYDTEYNSDAKLVALDTKNYNEDEKQLISSFASIKKEPKMISSEKLIKSVEAENIAKHAKTIGEILTEAETYIGTPYRYGGMTRSGIDCSAFVLSVFAVAGFNLPRVAAAQSQEGEKINKENLEKGDLLFFSHGRRISHVGIVYEVTPEGEVKFIHAATSHGVMISSLSSDSYWAPKFRFAKRVIPESSSISTLAATN